MNKSFRKSMPRTLQLQTELWSAIRAPALAQPTPLMALVVSGMNDVLNSQGIHPGRLLESNPNRGMGFDGSHRHRLQPAGRLWLA